MIEALSNLTLGVTCGTAVGWLLWRRYRDLPRSGYYNNLSTKQERAESATRSHGRRHSIYNLRLELLLLLGALYGFSTALAAC